MKHHLYRILDNSHLTYKELSTLLVRIEAVLNSRPLCPLTMDPDDLDVLTPGHFLIGSSLLSLPEIPESNLALNDRYIAIQRLTQQFWTRWTSDWLSHLQNRPKWHKKKWPNLQLNDLVIMKDHSSTNTWRLGRVVQLHPGEDNLVRVVTIRTQKGIFKRSISTLCKLPVCNEMNNTIQSIPTSKKIVYQKPGLRGGAPSYTLRQVVKKIFNVIVEGNIGSGKSTLLKFMKNSNEIEIIQEPVEKWCNLRGTNLLNLMYRNPDEWLFPFQSYVLLTMIQNHELVIDKRIKMMERSIFSTKNCFIEMAKRRNGTTHPAIFDIFDEWYQYIIQKSTFNVDLIIYLRTSPEISLERIIKRSLGEESNNQQFRVMTLDGDRGEDDIKIEYERAKNEIFKFANQTN